MCTFDQPLRIKSVKDIASKSSSFIARSDGFHMLMSFVRSVHILMDGSGLEELQGTAYGPNNQTSQKRKR